MQRQSIRGKLTLLLSLFIVVSTECTHAEFFRWTDEQGAVHYSDRATDISQAVTIQPGHAFYRVKKIYDGDTITLEGGQRIRLLGINTPEIEGRHKQEEPGGEAAKVWLTKQLEGQKIRLEKDRTKRDRYGRLLAHLFTQSGTHINHEIVKKGFAISNIHPPNLKYSERLLSAEKEAEKNGRGIWGMASYTPRPIHTIKSRKQRGWGRFTGKVKSLKKGRKFNRLIFSDTIDLRIPIKNQALFPPLNAYIGKQLEVRGWPARRKNHYSILVRHPGALVAH